MATATNVQEAAVIEQAGIDAIVAQGVEAGGHRGLFDPDVPDEGHRHGRAGAPARQARQFARRGRRRHHGRRRHPRRSTWARRAAQLGTAFILCPESAASAAYRENLQSERALHTRLTAALSGRPARGIVNALIAHGDAAGSPPPAAYPVAYDAAKQLHAAAARPGHHGYAAHWARQGAPLSRAMPAADSVRTLLDEMRAAGAAR
jgi:nitronate monooxygenase